MTDTRVATPAARRGGPPRGRTRRNRSPNHRDLARAFGANLRALRARANFTQADLAGPTLSRAGVAKLESGASLPSLATLEHLAHALGVSVRALVPRDL